MDLMDKFSIVIPAFNEQTGIKETLIELKKYTRNAEIIVIDDGSTDYTANVVGEIKNIRLIKHKKNRGYGSAIQTGILKSTRDYIVWYDADRQHRPEDLIAVCEKIVYEDLDYCIGVRSKDSHVDKSRILGKIILKFIACRVANQEVKDFNSGLRGFKKSVIIRYLSLLPNRFGASTVTTLLMLERGYSGEEVEISVRERVGTSSVKQFRDGMRTIGLMLQIVLLFRPMEVFSYLGILFILIGLIYGFYIAITQGSGFSSLAVIITVLGIQTLFFGLIMDQISRMRREGFDRSKNEI